MKKQNPQDILSEILLRMNYDSKKTLSENIMSLTEQGSYGYGSNVGSWMNATEKQGGANDPYEYKKEAGTYYYRKKGSTTNWIATTGAQANAIATKIFGDRAPFAVTNPTTNQVDQNTYPGPRKTTLSSYSSGDDGQDSDLVNTSQYPQYKYKETDKNRQSQSNYYYKLKNESYQKIIELLRDANTTSNSLQKAWNDFMFNYKMLYRDKDQWDDYRTLLNAIKNSTKFKITNGKIELKSVISSPKLVLPQIPKQKTKEELATEKQKTLDSLAGTPRPIKPEEPRALKEGDRCPPQIYATGGSGGFKYYYNTAGKVPANSSLVSFSKINYNLRATPQTCWTLNDYDRMWEQYYADLSYYQIWLEANKSAMVSLMKDAAQKAKDEIAYRDRYRDDVSQQRDAFATYRNLNNQKLYDEVVLTQLRNAGIDLEEAFKNNQSIPMEAWLAFREIWNYWGTQLVTISITLAPETVGLSTLAAFILDIGVDMFVFLVDLIIAWDNPDDSESWKRVVEDATTMVFYGAFSGIGFIMKKLASKSSAKTMNEALKEGAKDIKPLVKDAVESVSKVADENLPSSSASWVKRKLNGLIKLIDDFIVSAGVPKKMAPLFSKFIPIVGSFMIVLKLAESPISKFLEPLVSNLIGIPIQRLREIANGSIPTEEEKTVLEKVVVPEEIEKQFEEEEKENLKDKVTKSFDERISSLKEKTREMYKKDQSGTLQLIINDMIGDCKVYFQNLKNKGLIEVFLEVEGTGAILSYTGEPVTVGDKTVYSINGNYGFIKRYSDIGSEDASVIEDKDGNAIDCKKLNSELG